jgi:hypothetical protein
MCAEELRIQILFSEAAAHRLKPFSDFGFRPSFGVRVSVFGFQGCRHSPAFDRQYRRAPLPLLPFVSWCEQNRTAVVSKTGHFVVRSLSQEYVFSKSISNAVM